MRPFSAALLGLVALLCVAAVFVASAFHRDMAREYQRIQSRGEVIASPFGAIEALNQGVRTIWTRMSGQWLAPSRHAMSST